MKIKIPKKTYSMSPVRIEEKRVKDIYLSFRYLSSDSPGVKEYVVYNEFSVELEDINVIYGASGTGKTSLLKFFSDTLNSIYLNNLSLKSKYLINLVGDTTAEAIELLNYVGLGEGNLFLRTPYELSEGQLFRFKIAYQIYRHKDEQSSLFILIDEFGGVLDLATSKGISRMFHRICEKYRNIKFIVCCNNYDLACSFRYDVLIKMYCDNNVEVMYGKGAQKLCITDNYLVKKADIKDYFQFKKYHYLDLPDNEYEIYLVKDVDRKLDIACIVLSKVIPKECLSKHKGFQQINSSIINIKRLIVHPEYRSQGVTKFLLKELSKIRSEKIIEISSALFHFVPIPLSLGFEDINELFDGYYNINREHNQRIKKMIRNKGYNTYDLMDDSKYYEFLKIVDYNLLSKLAFEDMRERVESIVYYYYMIMKKYNIKVDGDLNELQEIFFENLVPNSNLTEDDIKELIQNNEQPSYGAYCVQLGKI